MEINKYQIWQSNLDTKRLNSFYPHEVLTRWDLEDFCSSESQLFLISPFKYFSETICSKSTFIFLHLKRCKKMNVDLLQIDSLSLLLNLAVLLEYRTLQHLPCEVLSYICLVLRAQTYIRAEENYLVWILWTIRSSLSFNVCFPCEHELYEQSWQLELLIRGAGCLPLKQYSMLKLTLFGSFDTCNRWFSSRTSQGE